MTAIEELCASLWRSSAPSQPTEEVGMAGNNPPRPKPCSPAMARVLVNLYRGRPPWCHLEGRSMHGGAGQTERALRARGWCEGFGNELVATVAGRERAAELVSN